MDKINVLGVSASALEAQRKRMNVIASNMANAHTTKTEDGGPYRRKDVVFSAVADEADASGLEAVKVTEVVHDESPFKMVYNPGHPDADLEGFVAMPNVDVTVEMVNMMMAFRAYEAAVATFNMSKSMYLKALELGRV